MKRIIHNLTGLIAMAVLLAGLPAFGQTSVVVEVYGMQFDPPSVTINVGDTVHWYNLEGTHNINGSLWYEDNPEPFGIEVGVGWEYSKVFTIPGTYQYHCDVHLDDGMTGVVVVEEGTSSVSEEEASNLIKRVYPIPADDYVIIELQDDVLSKYNHLQLRLYDHLGREQYKRALGIHNQYEIPLRSMNSGLYFYQLVDNESVLYTGKVVVK